MLTKRTTFILIGTIILSCSQFALAQTQDLKRSLTQADKLFQDHRYVRALTIYDSLFLIRPNDELIRYRTGVCYLFKPTEVDRAFDILLPLKENPAYPDILFDLGRSLQLTYQFESALEYYDAYLSSASPNDQLKEETEHYIQNCYNGIKVMDRRLGLNLQIAQSPSDALNSQYSPVISPDGTKLFYANRGPASSGTLGKGKEAIYFEDIFVSEWQNGAFQKGKPIEGSINTSDHESPMSISPDGKTMFVYRSGDSIEEDIYLSRSDDGKNWGPLEKAKGAINSSAWEGHASMSPDGKTVFFSSERPGGFGGSDIYSATLMADGSFGNVKNLGETINTELNEDSPFIHYDGRSLYFASQAHESIGGYDIHYSKYDSVAKVWSKPVNMGFPINTTDEDRFFNISSDGKRAFLSSSRASGLRYHDIYIIKPGTYEQLNRLVLLKGMVTINGNPVKAKVKIIDSGSGIVLADLNTEAGVGTFEFDLLPEYTYNLEIEPAGMELSKEVLTTSAASDSYTELEKVFEYFDEALALEQAAQQTLAEVGTPEEEMSETEELEEELEFSDTSVEEDSEAEVESPLPTENNAEAIESSVAGAAPTAVGTDPKREELTPEEQAAGYAFRVQVGAFRNPGQVKFESLRNLGEVELKRFEDGFTRCLMAPKFERRSEAEVLREKCVAAGYADAWITIRR